MKIAIIVSLVVICGLGVSCASQKRPYRAPYSPQPQSSVHKPATTTRADSPCTDSLYLALKSRPINQMTDREYQYFLQRDKQCMEYQQANAVAKTTVQPQADMVQEVKKANDAYTAYLVIGLIASLIALIPLMSLSP